MISRSPFQPQTFCDSVFGHGPALPCPQVLTPEPGSTCPSIHTQKVAQNALTTAWQGHRGVKGSSLAGSTCCTSMCTDMTAHTTMKAHTEHADGLTGAFLLKTPSNECLGIQQTKANPFCAAFSPALCNHLPSFPYSYCIL